MNKITIDKKDIPLSLYVHLPWCVQKCPYCDFNSHALRKGMPEKAYLEALLKDLAHDAKWANGRPLSSIFFGGGTPSLFSAQSIATLIEGFESMVDFAPDIEITMEANPGTVEHDSFLGYNQAGVNRISLGIQSFQDKHLESLGRIHRQAETLEVIAQLKALGINFNLDLMHGLPKQTLDEALLDLHTAIEFAPPHLSWYQLTLEPNTLFYKHPPALPSSDLRWQIELEGKKMLAQAGYENYEISAYAKQGKACRHNLNYWQFGDYIGIGAGAHGKLSEYDPHLKVFRTVKHRHPQKYLTAENFLVETNMIDQSNLIFEYMLNQLRLFAGIQFQDFITKTGLQLKSIKSTLDRLKQKELIELHQTGLKLTDLGKRFINDVTSEFLPVSH